MPITNHERLDALCAACGIALDYHDIRGQRHEPSFDVKMSLLAALRMTVNSDDDIERGLREMESRKWRQIVPPVVVCRQGDLPISLSLTPNERAADSMITLQLDMECNLLINNEKTNI